MGVDSEDMKEAGPAHTVYLDAFYLDQYEVTVEHYAKFLQASQWKEPDHWIDLRKLLDPTVPMTRVKWIDAVAYCHWAGKRLPTEAEWEKAARGTDGRRYPWGNEEPSKMAANVLTDLDSPKDVDLQRYDVRKHYGADFSEEHVRFAVKKWLRTGGSFPTDKSPYGIFDLGGNVGEWVVDWYDSQYYKRSPDRNPPGSPNGPDSNKVVRGGGGWVDSTSVEKKDTKSVYKSAQTFYRRGLTSSRLDAPGIGLGFRCAQDAK